MKNQLIVITGPTASGKTKLAINLAKEINAEIISADSRCVYKGLDIVSAKPTKEETEGICHHLIDIKEPLNEPYSAGDFVEDAKICIDEIFKKGKNVIIAGGTWFYIKCLLDEKLLPEIKKDEEERKRLETLDCNILWEMLKNLDEKRAGEIHPNNKERVIRAIEMAKFGTVADLERKENNLKALWFANEFALEENRKELYERINLRVDEMVRQGLEEEFKGITARLGRTKVLENTIGYKEFFELQDGIWENKETAIEKIKQRTRNFAKRQLTYFKTEKRLNIVKDEKDILNRLETMMN